MLSRIPFRVILTSLVAIVAAFGLVAEGTPREHEPYRASGLTPQEKFVADPIDGTSESILIVAKRTIPPGAPDRFTFTGDASGEIADGERIPAVRPSGFYQVTEDATTEWNLLSIRCDDTNSFGDVLSRTASYDLQEGEQVTCLFTNGAANLRFVDRFETGDTSVWSTTVGGTPPACAHSVCEEGGPLDPSCSTCVADICATDGFCCGTAWDALCVLAAASCDAICVP